MMDFFQVNENNSVEPSSDKLNSEDKRFIAFVLLSVAINKQAEYHPVINKESADNILFSNSMNLLIKNRMVMLIVKS